MRTSNNLLVLLLILSTIVIGMSVSVGRRLPLPEKVTNLHLTDCAFPCWIGIVPGKTTLYEALQRAKEVFGNVPGYEISSNLITVRLKNLAENIEIVILPDSWFQGDIVEAIDFSFRDLAVGDLLIIVDAPTHFSAWPSYGAGFIAIVCNNYTVGIKVDTATDEITPYTESDGLLLTSPSESSRLWVENYKSPRWHGFGKYPVAEMWLQFPHNTD